MQNSPNFIWELVPLYFILIIALLWLIERTKAYLIEKIRPEAEQEFKKPGYKVQRPEDKEWKHLSWSLWKQMVISQHSTRMVLVGLAVTALAAFVGLLSDSLTFGEFLLLIATSGTILILIVLVILDARYEREAAYHYVDGTDRTLDRVLKSLFSNKISRPIERLIVVSFLLIMTLLLHRAYFLTNYSFFSFLENTEFNHWVVSLFSKPQLLGLVIDIIGAYYLSRGFIFKNQKEILALAYGDEDLSKQLHGGLSENIAKSLYMQAVEARTGFAVLVFGFALQLCGTMFLNFSVAWWLGIVLIITTLITPHIIFRHFFTTTNLEKLLDD